MFSHAYVLEIVARHVFSDNHCKVYPSWVLSLASIYS